MSNSGVYYIEHKVSGKKYIGSSSDLKKRFQTHRRQLRKGTHANIKLQRSWDKYGEAAFAFAILELAKPRELLGREQFWLDRFDSAKYGFNIATIAGTPMPPGTRQPHTEKTKSKIRAKRALQTADVAGMHRANTGRKRSPEACAAISAGRTGMIFSEEHRQNIANSRIGTTVPPETRAKMSAAHRGKIVSAETRAKSSAARLGTKLSAESIAKRTATRRANAAKEGRSY